MAKSTETTTAEPTPEAPALFVTPAAAVASAPTLTVNEFCRRKSETVRRTELIAAFFSHETREGNVKDTAEAFEARFKTFINKPA